MYQYDEIKAVHLEVTQRCQASCPMCDRNENGGVVNRHLTNAELSIADCKQIFKPEFIAKLDRMYMCGNHGDPIIAEDTLEIFKYFRDINPKMWLSMNTNAGAQESKWWVELAKIFGRMGAVLFSVDGLEDTNHLYRQNVQWPIVMNSMQAFIGAGGRARWDYIIFNHNEHQVDEAEKISQTMGFEKFQKKKTGRFYSTNKFETKTEHQAKNIKGKDTQKLTRPVNKENTNKALDKVAKIEEKYGSMHEYHDKVKINCKVAKEKNIYISAEGLMLPCCWTAGRMYKWWFDDPKQEQIWDYIGDKDSINVKKHGLQTVMENGFIQSIQHSWGLPNTKSGKLKVCADKCGEEFDAFKEQYK